MTTAELLIAIDEALAITFPDRAAAMLRVVRRWLWFANPAPAIAGKQVDDLVLPYSPARAACAWCRRSGVWTFALVAAIPARPRGIVWRPVRWSPSPVPDARAVLCGACACLAADVAEEPEGTPERVLADLSRALTATDDGERASGELGRRAAVAAPPVRETERHCGVCREHAPEGAVGRGEVWMCNACVASAAAAARAADEGPLPLPEEDS